MDLDSISSSGAVGNYCTRHRVSVISAEVSHQGYIIGPVLVMKCVLLFTKLINGAFVLVFWTIQLIENQNALR